MKSVDLMTLKLILLLYWKRELYIRNINNKNELILKLNLK